MREHLTTEVRTFGRQNPDQSRFASALLETIKRVGARFHGDKREELLLEVKETFERQVEIIRNTARTFAALEALKQTQKQAMKLLNPLPCRPSNTTLH